MATKDFLSKVSGVLALGTGVGGAVVLAQDIYTKTMVAYETCYPVVVPVWLAVVAFLAYFSKSPLQPKNSELIEVKKELEAIK